MQTIRLTQRPGTSASSVIAGTLIWTDAGPCPVESVQPGDKLVGFDPHRFGRESASVQGVQHQRGEPCLRVLAGGRVLTVPASQWFTVFDLDGNHAEHPASHLQPGMWIPVDRRVPTPLAPIVLPNGDDELSALLGEDALAMTDALHSPQEYFAEMGKRGLRLKLLELSGYLLGAGTVIAGDVAIEDDEGEVVAYYSDILQRTFGTARDRSPATLARRLERWMGGGLAHPSRRAVPAWAFRLENQGRTALLRGFFDARGTVAVEEISVQSPSQPLLVGIQTLLGATAIEATLQPARAGKALVGLSIRNVRRFAEWVHSNVTHKAAVLRMVYAREPRYPTDGTARLPLSIVRPALERIRAAYPLSQRPATAERVDEREVSTVETLRLLATAFHDEPLRERLNDQLFLEPITLVEKVPGSETVEVTFSGSSSLVANGIIVGRAAA